MVPGVQWRAGSYVVNSSASENVTVSAATTANALLAPRAWRPGRMVQFPVVILSMLLLLAFTAVARRMGVQRWYPLGALLAALTVVCIPVGSCSGGGSSTPPANNGTPPGSYTVTVFAFTESNTSDGTAQNADATATIPVTVN